MGCFIWCLCTTKKREKVEYPVAVGSSASLALAAKQREEVESPVAAGSSTSVELAAGSSGPEESADGSSRVAALADGFSSSDLAASAIELSGLEALAAGFSCIDPAASSRPAALRVAKGEGEDRRLVFIGNIEKKFDLDDLMLSTLDVLGEGKFGRSLKANLGTGPVVMKLLRDVRVSETKFVEIVDTIGNIKHENLQPVKAYHCSKNEKLLIYDYMPMGSLSALLQRNREAGIGKTPLTWDTWCGIVLGVTRAITHLHSQSSTTFHGNIKASNILLTTSMEARVSDYLLNYIAEPSHASKHLEFDVGYCASESEMSNNGEVSKEREKDVYRFGLVLLELLTGKTAIFQDEFTSENVILRRWILAVIEDELTSQVFDLDLLRYVNVEEDLLRLLEIAMDCTSQYAWARPSMVYVRSQIEKLCRGGP